MLAASGASTLGGGGGGVVVSESWESWALARLTNPKIKKKMDFMGKIADETSYPDSLSTQFTIERGVVKVKDRFPEEDEYAAFTIIHRSPIKRREISTTRHLRFAGLGGWIG